MATANRTLAPKLDFSTVTKDPEFLALEFAEQRKVLLDIDTDFSGLPVGEQFKVITEINQPPQDRGFFSAVGERSKQIGQGALEILFKPDPFGLSADLVRNVKAISRGEIPGQSVEELQGRLAENQRTEDFSRLEKVADFLGLPVSEIKDAAERGETGRIAGLLTPDAILLLGPSVLARLGLGRFLRGRSATPATRTLGRAGEGPIAPVSRQLPAARIQVPIQSTGEVPLGQIRTTALKPTAPLKPTASLELLGAQESGGIVSLRFGPESVVTKETINQLFKGSNIEVAKLRSIHTVLGADPRMVQSFSQCGEFF